MVNVSRPVCVFTTSQGMCLMQEWCDFSYRTHDFEPFASSYLGHPNRLTLIQLRVIGMSSVGWLGDRDLPM